MSIWRNDAGEGLFVAVHELVDQTTMQDARRQFCIGGFAWVPCAERMPEEGVDVLIVFGVDEVVTIARWDGERAWWSDEERVKFPAVDVTHWMPLPPPPA
jgi:hypothetical protein